MTCSTVDGKSEEEIASLLGLGYKSTIDGLKEIMRLWSGCVGRCPGVSSIRGKLPSGSRQHGDHRIEKRS